MGKRHPSALLYHASCTSWCGVPRMVISVQVPDVVSEQIASVARSRGQFRFAVVREAITQIVSEAEPAAETRPRPRALAQARHEELTR
jgi:hypothetical protein